MVRSDRKTCTSQQVAGHAGKRGIELRVFTEFDEALAWLERGDSASFSVFVRA